MKMAFSGQKQSKRCGFRNMISEYYTTQDCSNDFSDYDCGKKGKESCVRHFISYVKVSHVDNESHPEEKDRVEDRAEQVVDFVNDPF